MMNLFSKVKSRHRLESNLQKCDVGHAKHGMQNKLNWHRMGPKLAQAYSLFQFDD